MELSKEMDPLLTNGARQKHTFTKNTIQLIGYNIEAALATFSCPDNFAFGGATGCTYEDVAAVCGTADGLTTPDEPDGVYTGVGAGVTGGAGNVLWVKGGLIDW